MVSRRPRICDCDADVRSTEGEDTVGLGNLGLGLEIPEDGVLVELSLSATYRKAYGRWVVAHLTVERVDLARDELVGLLGVWVGKEVVLDLLRLSGHLRVLAKGTRGTCMSSKRGRGWAEHDLWMVKPRRHVEMCSTSSSTWCFSLSHDQNVPPYSRLVSPTLYDLV
jgi:hypothetical protein